MERVESPQSEALTTIETALRDTWAVATVARIGVLARAHGWPQPDEAQCSAITQLVIAALTEIVRGMRHPDALPPSQEEVHAVLDGVASGVLEKVMTSSAESLN